MPAHVDVAAATSLESAARDAFARQLPMYFRTGVYAYDGPGLAAPRGRIVLLGEPGAVVELHSDAYFVDTDALITGTLVKNMSFQGGQGAVRYRREAANVTFPHIFDNVGFIRYQADAVHARSADMPSFRFRACEFVGADNGLAVGIRLGSRAAGTLIESCRFASNLAGVQIRDGAPNVTVSNCSFAGVGPAAQAGVLRGSVWIEPTGLRSAGFGAVVEDCTFSIGQDEDAVPIVLADAGRHDVDDIPASAGVVDGHVYVRNRVIRDSESAIDAFVLSSAASYRGIIRNTLAGGSAPIRVLVTYRPPVRGDVPVPETDWVVSSR